MCKSLIHTNEKSFDFSLKNVHTKMLTFSRMATVYL
jgi:hypothetical protein